MPVKVVVSSDTADFFEHDRNGVSVPNGGAVASTAAASVPLPLQLKQGDPPQFKSYTIQLKSTAGTGH